MGVWAAPEITVAASVHQIAMSFGREGRAGQRRAELFLLVRGSTSHLKEQVRAF